MHLFKLGLATMAMVQAGVGHAESRISATPPSLTYADLADLAVAAPIAAHVSVKQALALKPSPSDVPPGVTRFYVEAQVLSLIRGAQGLPAVVRYLVDIPNDSKGRAARPSRKTEYLVLGDVVKGRPGDLRLIAPDAQLLWTPALAQQAREMLREATAEGAAPRIIGIGKAFHVEGTLPGESETQFFLLAAGGRPISLTVLRRPGQQPRWAVALGEIVDEAASAPKPESLLWYRLACGLPSVLPGQSVAGLDPTAVSAVRADYQLILASLGPCTRLRPRWAQG